MERIFEPRLEGMRGFTIQIYLQEAYSWPGDSQDKGPKVELT